MDVSLFDFNLPENLIAQSPAENRIGSRLMVVDRQREEVLHHQFADFPRFLQPGDVLVINDTRVRPARLRGRKQETGARIELLLLKPLGEDRWEALVKPAKRLKPGTRVEFGQGQLSAVAEEKAEIAGGWIVRLEYEEQDFEKLLQELGEMPLPPYIREDLKEPERYQTVYSRYLGSAAAPTAGLHFTSELLREIEDMGVEVAPVTLHVGLGTFRPVATERVEEHQMHAEFYQVGKRSAACIQQAKQEGRRIIAVGTTSVRTLEAVACRYGEIRPCSGWTDIYIYPGYSFKMVDALLTNFHLPQSSLLMLVSAFASRETILRAYKEAVNNQYRFFSFGDAMFII